MIAKEYVSLYSENNITFWGDFDKRPGKENIIQEVIITKEVDDSRERLYFTGNNLYLSIENLAEYVDKLVYLINNGADSFQIKKWMDVFFYDFNYVGINMIYRNIKRANDEKAHSEMNYNINIENKQLLKQLKNKIKNMGYYLINLQSKIVIMQGGIVEKLDIETIKRAINNIESLEYKFIKDYIVGVIEIYENEIIKDKGFKYQHEIENYMYKWILNNY